MSTPQTDRTATQDQAADARAARIRELMLDNFSAVFNQRDPERRLKAITANYTEDVIWTDPEGTAQGHQAMNELGQKLLDRLPNFVFSAAGPVHVSGDLGLLAFNLGIPEQPPAFSGIDVALVRDGRIALLYTILTAENRPPSSQE
jgi:ketosteroid isomerase-like protein